MIDLLIRLFSILLMMKMAQVLVARLAARIGRLAMVKAMGMLFTMVDFSLTYKYSNTNTQIQRGMLSVNSGGLPPHQAEVKVGTNQHSLSPKLHTLKRGMRRGMKKRWTRMNKDAPEKFNFNPTSSFSLDQHQPPYLAECCSWVSLQEKFPLKVTIFCTFWFWIWMMLL